jgi:hypothetical protein
MHNLYFYNDAHASDPRCTRRRRLCRLQTAETR